VAYFIVNMITKPVIQAVEGIRTIASGDLTQRWDVKSKDELGNMLADMNGMADALTAVVTDVRNGSNEIGVASNEIAKGNLDLSQRTEEQASSLEETASSMEEMTSTVKQNADNTRQANQLAMSTREQAEKGGEVLSNAVDAMAAITNSSKKIADIIGVIDEIAFQTNLLALNAAVEAARAGEQGRGFAVVASEVRTLAGRSADAAKEIKGLITDSVEKVDLGSELVDASGKTLEEIVTGVKKVTDIISEIAASSQEQANGIEQVNSAVMQMDEMTQQNAALVEEAAAASSEMTSKVKLLSGLSLQFKLEDN
jgi:methyl-accepting chemotaxis protein